MKIIVCSQMLRYKCCNNVKKKKKRTGLTSNQCMKRKRVWLWCRRLSMFYTIEDSLTSPALTPGCSGRSWAILSGKLGRADSMLSNWVILEAMHDIWHGVAAIRNAYKALHSLHYLPITLLKIGFSHLSGRNWRVLLSYF